MYEGKCLQLLFLLRSFKSVKKAYTIISKYSDINQFCTLTYTWTFYTSNENNNNFNITLSQVNLLVDLMVGLFYSASLHFCLFGTIDLFYGLVLSIQNFIYERNI